MFPNDASTGNCRMMWRSPRLLLPIIVIFSLLTLWYTRNHTHFSVSRIGLHQALPAPDSVLVDEKFPDIRNATLGFEQVYILNLPERTDKLDAFSLASSVSGFSFAVIPGVDGATVPDKSLPSTKDLPEGPNRDTSVGSWRAHLNFALTIVRNRLSTAIVFEDDADWDISFKTQLEHLAAGSRYLLSAPDDPKPHSPYGDNWDLLWPGHCATSFQPNNTRRYIIDNDPSVPPPNHRVTFGNKPNLSHYSNSTRLVFEAGGGVCVYAYALSFRGAQKLLHRESTRDSYQPFDLALDELCRNDPDFQCISVYPQIIDSYKAPGAVNKDSDISHIKSEGERKTGYTFNIVRSVRINLRNLIRGNTEKAKVQWNDQPEVVGPMTTRTV